MKEKNELEKQYVTVSKRSCALQKEHTLTTQEKTELLKHSSNLQQEHMLMTQEKTELLKKLIDATNQKDQLGKQMLEKHHKEMRRQVVKKLFKNPSDLTDVFDLSPSSIRTVKKTIKTPAVLADLLDLSPASVEAVKRAQSQRSLHSRSLKCVADGTNRSKRSTFLENTVRTLKPLVRGLCAQATFGLNKDTDEKGVARLVSEKLMRDPSRRNSKRKRLDKHFLRDTDVVPKDLKKVFKEFGSSWRVAMRQHNRGFADKLLQLCLKTIPLHCCGKSASN